MFSDSVSRTSSMGDDLIRQLPLISLQLNRIVPIFQIILGTFGNIMNILIFTRRPLRTNPCSLYFLASSINNLFVLYVGALTRLLSSGWKIDPSNSNQALCKLRTFFVYTSLCLIQWFVVLASIDRYLSSCQSARFRQLSSVSIARRSILAVIFVIGVAHFHIFVWWSVDYIGTKTYCNIFQYDYEIAFQVFFLILTCVLPTILMAIFGTLTIFNVKKLRSQVAPQNRNNERNGRLRSKDRQMILMLLIQVLVTMLCTLPFSVANIATMFVQYVITVSDYDDAINTFYGNLGRLVNYFNPVVGFYIYTLSSRAFRSEMKGMITNVINFIMTRFGLERLTPPARGKVVPNNTQQSMSTMKNVVLTRPMNRQGTITELDWKRHWHSIHELCTSATNICTLFPLVMYLFKTNFTDAFGIVLQWSVRSNLQPVLKRFPPVLINNNLCTHAFVRYCFTALLLSSLSFLLFLIPFTLDEHMILRASVSSETNEALIILELRVSLCQRVVWFLCIFISFVHS